MSRLPEYAPTAAEAACDEDEPETCDGSGEVTGNPSRNGDPQAEVSYPCPGCVACETEAVAA